MYYVIQRARCNECNGTGWVRNHLWDEFWGKYGDEIRAAEELSDPVATNQIIDRIFHEFWGDEEEPEEFECSECDGTGEIVREVPLAEALAALEKGGHDEQK